MTTSDNPAWRLSLFMWTIDFLLRESLAFHRALGDPMLCVEKLEKARQEAFRDAGFTAGSS